MRRIIVSLSLIAACATNTYAQEPMALSLQAAMDHAVKNNAAAKNARIDVLIQDAQNKQVTAAALPQVNGKGEFTQFFNIQKAFLPGSFIPGGDPNSFVPVAFTPRYSATASASGSQLLFDGSVLVALQARNTVMELARKKGQFTEEYLRYEVQKAYYGIVIAQRQLSILSNSLQYLRKVAGDLEKMRAGGFVEKIEVDRTKVQVNNLATDSLRASSFLLVSEQGLKFAMGMPINTPIILTDTSVEKTLEDGLLLTNTPVNYENRTDFSLLQTAQQLNGYNLKRYKLAALPTLAAAGSLGYNYGANTFQDITTFTGNTYQFFSFGALQLNIPIFSGFRRTNQVREAKLLIDRTNNSIDSTKLAIDFEVERFRTTFKNSILQLESQQRNLELAGTVVDLAQKKYNAGVGSNIEVNQAQTELLSAQANYFSSLIEAINAQSDLKRALGNFK